MTACLLVACASSQTAETIPPIGSPFTLPADMHAEFEGPEYADLFELPGLTPGRIARCSLSFRNSGDTWSVKTRWIYRTADSSGRIEGFVHTTSFQPTAIAAHGGTTDTFYVAGWTTRGRRAVIEEWTVTDAALGETIKPDGSAVATFTEPTIARREIWSRAGFAARPIEGLAADPTTDTLYVLEYGPEARLSSLDLDALDDPATDLVEVATALSVPEIENVEQIVISYHLDGGIVLGLLRHRAWRYPQEHLRSVIRDVTGDGIIDTSIVSPPMSRAEFHELYPSKDWSLDY